LALLSPLTPAATLPTTFLQARDLSIPGPPADPPQPPEGDGAGPYDSIDAGWLDYLKKAQFYAIATAAGEIGMVNAERNMRHYLGNTGDDLHVHPGPMMQDLPQFRESAQALAQNEATKAYEAIAEESGGERAFSSAWETYYATQEQSNDWYFAIGGFSFSVTGVVTKKPGGGSLKYQVHIFDRYNWDEGKFVHIGPIRIDDSELAELHLKGLAREYVVRGSSEVNDIGDFKP
ncbi:uncharacterized protein EI97DRAFT_349469, partial [Westerdykella ornata]